MDNGRFRHLRVDERGTAEMICELTQEVRLRCSHVDNNRKLDAYSICSSVQPGAELVCSRGRLTLAILGLVGGHLPIANCEWVTAFEPTRLKNDSRAGLFQIRLRATPTLRVQSSPSLSYISSLRSLFSGP